MLTIEGAIVTIDAMGCQRDIARKVIDKKERVRRRCRPSRFDNHPGLGISQNLGRLV
jgi:predicted transposase YbfD/YdcC